MISSATLQPAELQMYNPIYSAHVPLSDQQKAQISLTNRPTPDWTDFATFTYSLSYLTPSMRGIPASYRVHIWYGKTRMAGLQSGAGHTMITSIVWAQYINVTDTQTDSHAARCKRRANAVCIGIRVAKIEKLRNSSPLTKPWRRAY